MESSSTFLFLSLPNDLQLGCTSIVPLPNLLGESLHSQTIANWFLAWASCSSQTLGLINNEQHWRQRFQAEFADDALFKDEIPQR